MKKIICDKCGADRAKTFIQDVVEVLPSIDLCIPCMQDFILENRVRLVEVLSETQEQITKHILHG